MLVIAGGVTGFHAWRSRQRDDIAVAGFLLGTAAIEVLRWMVLHAPPLSAGWYLSVGLFLAQSAAPAALALFVLARRSPWPAGALLAAALIAFGLDAGSVRGALLYKVTDIATTAIALLCIVPLWQRRSRLTLAVAISLLIVMVLSVGAVAHAVDFADTRIWRVHMAAEVTVFMLAAAFYLRRIVRNGEAS